MARRRGERLALTSREASLWASVAFIPLLYVTAVVLYHWHADLQLDKVAKTAPGIITKIEFENHRLLDYEFNISGRTYTGAGAIPGDDSQDVGQSVTVTYLPTSPQINSLEPFGALGGREGPILFCAIIGSVVYFRVRRHLRREAEAPSSYDE